MRLILNIIWFLLGGWAVALEYFVSSLLLMVTIIGIPFGLQSMKMGVLALWPFGRTATPTGRDNGCISAIMSLIWLIIGGLWIALTHVLLGAVLCITIIGIPFGMQHFKLAGLAFYPFGMEITEKY